MKARGDAIEVSVCSGESRAKRGTIWRRPYRIYTRKGAMDFVRFNYQWFLLEGERVHLPEFEFKEFATKPGKFNGELN